MERSYWTDDRQRLFDWITSNGSESFAELYKGAVFNLYERIPGYTRFVSHAARDIMNRMARFRLGIASKQTDYVALVNALTREWKKNGLPRRKMVPIEKEPLSETTDVNFAVNIPTDVLEVLQDLIEEHEEGGNRSKMSPFLFFQAYLTKSGYGDTPPEAFIKTWKTLHRWFQKRSHESGTPPTADQKALIEKKFVQLEAIMLAVADKYQQSLGRIDEILDQANK